MHSLLRYFLMLSLVLLGSVSADTVSTPEFLPTEGDGPAVFDVTIQCATPGAAIRYTIDGTDPVASSVLIPPSGKIRIAQNFVLKARAFKDGMTESEVQTALYRLTGVITAGSSHVLVLHVNGKVYGWGAQNPGRLGNGTTATGNVFSPVMAMKGANDPLLNMWDVSTNYSTSVAVGADGTVWAFGDNPAGQVGDNTVTDRGYARRVLKADVVYESAVESDFLSNIVGASMGYRFGTAVEKPVAGGKVWAWGERAQGRLGDGYTGTGSGVLRKYAGLVTTTDLNNPSLANAVQVRSGTNFSFALTDVDSQGRGLLWAWGVNTTGQLSQGNTSIVDRAVRMKLDATATTYPTGNWLNDVVDFSAGMEHAAAIRQSGSGERTVWCWGNRGNGRCGDGYVSGASSYATYPVQVIKSANQGGGPLTGINQVAAGPRHTLALGADGRVWSWGKDTYGQLGDGGTSDRANADVVKLADGSALANVVAIAAGGHDFGTPYPGFSVALRDDGTMFGWGYNSNGQTGNESTTPTSILYATPATFATKFNNIAPTINLTVTPASMVEPAEFSLSASAADSDGSVASVSFYENGALLGVDTAAPFTWTASARSAGEYVYTALAVDNLGAQSMASQSAISLLPPPVQVPTVFPPGGETVAVEQVMISSTPGATIFYTLDGSVPTISSSSIPANTLIRIQPGAVLRCYAAKQGMANSPVQEEVYSGTARIAAGHLHTLMLCQGKIWAWGRNEFGQLGIGTAINASSPTLVPEVSNVVDLAAGASFSMALRDDDTVWTWGNNSMGQLGDGTLTNRAVPAIVPEFPGVITLASGASHSVALRNDKTVWTWGGNSHFQLGTSVPLFSATPIQTTLTDIVDICAGAQHSLALRANGTVLAWGAGTAGQLGDGNAATSSMPVEVSGLTDVVAIAAGDQFSIALKSNGTVVAWGRNDCWQTRGQAGADSSLPVAIVGVSQIVGIAAGGSHVVAIQANGNVLCWGQNSAGQCTGPVSGAEQPKTFVLTHPAVPHAVAGGLQHSVALDSNGDVWLWGGNADGQLGDGSTLDRLTPLRVQSIDMDGDGMPNDWEIANGLNPSNPSDASLDSDQDGILNSMEFVKGINPNDVDSDGDGLRDDWELASGYNPAVCDSDNDGTNDGAEDFDGDRMPNAYEVRNGLDAKISDAMEDLDGDRWPNIFEWAHGVKVNEAGQQPDPDNLVANPPRRLRVKPGSLEVDQVAVFDEISLAVSFASSSTSGAEYSVVQVDGGRYHEFPSFGWNSANQTWTGHSVLLLGEQGSTNGPVILDGEYSHGTSSQAVLVAGNGDAVVDSIVIEHAADGALYSFGGARVRMLNCILRNNLAERGGGIFAEESTVDLIHCTLIGNSASLGGSAINAHTRGHVTLTESILWNPAGETEEIQVDELGPDSGSVTLDTSIISDGGFGGITTNPGLRTDGRLMAAGNARTILGPRSLRVQYDIDGELRGDGTPDIGADEFVDKDEDNFPDVLQEGVGKPDHDRDELTNAFEYNVSQTNWLVADTDGDTMSDGWEYLHGLDPNVTDDPTANPDGDAWDNQQESLFGTDPNLAEVDSDTDNLPDVWETRVFGDLLETEESDLDNDWYTTIDEVYNRTDPNDYYNGAAPYPVPFVERRDSLFFKPGFDEFPHSLSDATKYDRYLTKSIELTREGAFDPFDEWPSYAGATITYQIDPISGLRTETSSGPSLPPGQTTSHVWMQSGKLTATDQIISPTEGERLAKYGINLSTGASYTYSYQVRLSNLNPLTVPEMYSHTMSELTPWWNVFFEESFPSWRGIAERDAWKGGAYIEQSRFYWKFQKNPQNITFNDYRKQWLVVFTPKDDPETAVNESLNVKVQAFHWPLAAGESEPTNIVAASPSSQQSPTFEITAERNYPGQDGRYEIMAFELSADLDNDGTIGNSNDNKLKGAASQQNATDEAREMGTEYLFANDQLSNGAYDGEDPLIPRDDAGFPETEDDDDTQEIKIVCNATFGAIWFEHPLIDKLAFYTDKSCDPNYKITFPFQLSSTNRLDGPVYIRAEGATVQVEGDLIMNFGLADKTEIWAEDKLRLTIVKELGNGKYFQAVRDYILENNTLMFAHRKGYPAANPDTEFWICAMREEATKMESIEAFHQPNPKKQGLGAIVKGRNDLTVVVNGNQVFFSDGWEPTAGIPDPETHNMSDKCHGRLVYRGVLSPSSSDNADKTTTPKGSELADETANYISQNPVGGFTLAKGRVPIGADTWMGLGGLSTNYDDSTRANLPQTIVGFAPVTSSGKGVVFTASQSPSGGGDPGFLSGGRARELAEDAHRSGVPDMPGAEVGRYKLLVLDSGRTSVALAHASPKGNIVVRYRGAKHFGVPYYVNTYLAFKSARPR